MISNKIYQATPEHGPDDKGGPILVINSGTGKAVDLDPRLDLINHSPTGFGWGYNGSGPAQTALAILADVTGDDARALRIYQQFKNEVISNKVGKWEISQFDVTRWLLYLDPEAAA